MNPVESIRKIEEKWQEEWEKARIFEADYDPTKPKMFVTFPYPYINGIGHVGHLYTFMKAEIYARYMRMRGFNVLFPQGFHATGQPIVAAARRLREGDPKWRKILKMYGINDDEIELFYDPKYWIKHFMRRWIAALKKIGASIDWRRTFHTTELNPAYDRFIRWQYRKLQQMGLIIRAKHPVVWCPKEQIPVGDHDRSEGEGVVPEEIVVIKFRMGDKILPAGTYRPETTYGVTNMWINPEATYVEAKVDGEIWVVSKEAVEKLKFLGKEVDVLREYKGKDLLGMYVENPVTNEKIPILPGAFVDPDFATGVVMSVPAHAPYDWIALEDLKKDPEWKHIVENIRPRSLIKLEGYSEFPAKDAIEKYGITSQKDVEKLEKATEEIYKKEFYEGKLREMFGNFSGMTVQEAKEGIVKMFLSKNWATTMWVLPKPVICRCGARCVVHIVDQWFLKYSDPAWKAKAHEAVENTVWIPPEVRNMVHTTIDWLRDWACTRDVRASLGTRLPWDSTQYIESLSDSTVYMAYYTIAKWLEHADEYGIDVNRLNDAFFDYVFYGKGDANKISEETGIPTKILEEMRREFEYWYPVDLRVTAKDLVQNHLTFSIFHHVVLFPGKHIRQWGVNGWVLLSGKKMSKSKGNVITIEEAPNLVGADPLRFVEAYAGNATLDDANIDMELAKSMAEKLLSWVDTLVRLYNAGREEENIVDRWFLSKIQGIIRRARESYELLRTRDATNEAWFNMWSLFRKYLRLTGDNPNRKTINYAIETWIKLMAPITPHICEEAWHKIGKRTFVSVEGFPTVEKELLDEKAEQLVDYAQQLVDDIKQVVKLARVEKPKKVIVVLADKRLYEVIPKVKELVLQKKVQEAINAIPADIKPILAPIVQKALRNPGKIPDVIGSRADERNTLETLKVYITSEIGLPVEIVDEYDHPKAKNALPFRPAIIVI